MQRVLVVLAYLLLVPGAIAGSSRSVIAPGPLLVLSAEGSRIAYAIGRSTRDCNRVYVWHLGNRTVTKLGRKTHCEETSTGNRISAISLAGKRALWLHYVGGNSRDWTLWTATTTRPTPVLLRSVTIEADSPPPIVLGNGVANQGFADILPYAIGRRVVALRANGTIRFVFRAPERVVALSTFGEVLAVATAGGKVYDLDSRGKIIATESYDDEVAALALTGNGTIVFRGRTVEYREQERTRTWLLPSGARFVDGDYDRALFVARGQVQELLFESGARTTLGPGVDAHVLDTRGRFVAIASGRRVLLVQRLRAG